MAKILLVEDDNNLREIYEARLQAEGYEIVSARDGEEALTVAMKEKPDLIISDVMMPKISGFDMLDIIRSTEETKNSKVIMMTALSQAEDKERATKLGADRYLVKSQVTLEDVAKVAREVLEGETSSAPAAPEPAKVSADVNLSDSTASVTPAADPTPEPATPPTSDSSTPPVPAPEPASTPAPVSPPTEDATNDASVTPTAPPVEEPTVPVVDPAQAVAQATVPPAPQQTDEPTVIAPTTLVPAPEPASTPATVTSPAPEPAATTTPAPTPADEQGSSVEAIGQSVKEEQDAIAAQIEDFIDSNKSSDAAGQAEPPKAEEEPSPTPVNFDEQTEVTDESEPSKKKVIQPINDINASAGPNLEALLIKEEEKEKMAQIAKQITANPDATTSPEAQPTTSETPTTQPSAVETQPSAPSQAPAAETVAQAPQEASPQLQPPAAPVQPPQSSGNNIDGIVKPTSPATNGPDPNAITL